MTVVSGGTDDTEWYDSGLKILPQRHDYLLLAASLLGLVAVFLYVYNLVADRDGTFDDDDDDDGDEVNGGDVDDGLPLPRTKRLTKDERKALRRLHASRSTGSTRKRAAVRLDADALTTRMWHLPLTSTLTEALATEEAVRSALVCGGMHVEHLADLLEINCYQALASIKECEKKGQLRGYLAGDGVYRVLRPEDIERFAARVSNEPITVDELRAFVTVDQ